MFRRKPTHERMANEVISELKRRRLSGDINPNDVVSWEVSYDMQGQIDIHVPLRPITKGQHYV